MMRWKLRAPYFQGANAYDIGPEGGKIRIDVNMHGYFELLKPPEFMLGIFASQATDRKPQTLQPGQQTPRR